MTDDTQNAPELIEGGIAAYLADLRAHFDSLDYDPTEYDRDLGLQQLDMLAEYFADMDDDAVTMADLEIALNQVLQNSMSKVIDTSFGEIPQEPQDDFSFKAHTATMIEKVDKGINNISLMLAGMDFSKPLHEWSKVAPAKAQSEMIRKEMIYTVSLMDNAKNLGRQIGSSNGMFSGEDGDGAQIAAFTLDAMKMALRSFQMSRFDLGQKIGEKSIASLSELEISNSLLQKTVNDFLEGSSLDSVAKKYVFSINDTDAENNDADGEGADKPKQIDYSDAVEKLLKEINQTLEVKKTAVAELLNEKDYLTTDIAEKHLDLGLLLNEQSELSDDTSPEAQARRAELEAEIVKANSDIDRLNANLERNKTNLQDYNADIKEYTVVEKSLSETYADFDTAKKSDALLDAGYKLLGIGSSISSMLANGLSGQNSTTGYAAAGMNMAADVIDGLAAIAKYKDSYKNFNSGAGAVSGLVGVGPQMASFSQAIMDLKDAPPEMRGFYIGEAVVQGVNMAMGLAIGAMTTYAALAGNSISSMVPVVGVMSSLVSAINPLQWASFKQQNEHLDDVRAKTDIESEAYETSADFLSQLLETSRNIEVGYYVAETAVAVGGGVGSSALAATGFGAPVALALAGFTAGLQGLLAATKQTALNNAAENIAEKIRAFDGGVEGFFDQSFDYQADKELEAFFDQAQALIDQGFDNVSALGSVQMTGSDLELAAMSGIGGELARTQDHYAGYLDSDDLGTGNWDKEQIYFKNGTIHHGDAAEEATGESTMLQFISPMAAAGEEELTREKTGKNKYETTLKINDLSGWTLIDGGDNTTFDLRNVVTKARDSINAPLKDIEMKIQGNAGDDMFLMTETSGSQTNTAGSPNIDGGSGQDSVTYANLTTLTEGLSVRTNSAGNLVVEKTLDASTMVLEGAIGTYQTQRGKETETVEYSYIDANAIGEETKLFDELKDIEMLALSTKDDDIRVADYNKALVIAGLGGDDYMELGQGQGAIGGEGDDSFLLAGDLKTVGETENDLPETVEISGGEGFDTILLEGNWAETLFKLGAHYLVADQILQDDAELLAAMMPENLASELGEDIAVATVANLLSEDQWAMTSILAFNEVENVDWELETMVDVVFEGGLAELNGIIDLGEFSDAAQNLLNRSTIGDYTGRITYDASDFAGVSGQTSYVINGTARGEGIRGTAFADTLFGGDGDDWLDGQAGTNRLVGAAGADSFYFDMTLTSDTTVALVDPELATGETDVVSQTAGDHFVFHLGATPTTQLAFSKTGDTSSDLEISTKAATVVIEDYFTAAYSDYSDGPLFTFSTDYGETQMGYDDVEAHLGDGSNGSLSVSYMGARELYILAGQEHWGDQKAYLGQNAYKGDQTNLIIGDFDGDGKYDFIEQREGHNYIAKVNLSTGEDSFAYHGTVHNSAGTSSSLFRGDLTNMIVGDFNGDGKDDFIRQEKGRWDDDNNNTAQVFLATGDGDFKKQAHLSNLTGGGSFKGDLTNLIVGDFNGDGRDDFIRQEKGRYDDDDNGTARIYLSQNNGTFKRSGDLQALTNQDEDIFKGDETRIITGDFNGDGRDDFIRQDYKPGADNILTTEIYLATEDGKFEFWDDLATLTGQKNGIFNGEDTKLYVDDFDGDGRDDFIVQDSTYYADIYLAQELIPGFAYEKTQTVGAKHNVQLMTGDVDGDGDADIFRQEYNAWDNDDRATARVYELEFA